MFFHHEKETDIPEEEIVEEPENEGAQNSRYLILPIIIDFLMLGLLLIRNTEAAVSYLYALVPLLLGTAFFGNRIYNRDGDMRLFSAAATLTAIGTALQVLIDQVYNPISSFSIIKLIVSVGVGFLFVQFYRLFRLLLNKSFTVWIMMGVSAAIYLILLAAGSDPNGYGTSAWISIGGITFQLTDFAKVSAVLFYSALFSSETAMDDRKILILSTVFFFINMIGSVLIRELGSFFILYFLHLSILFIFMRRSDQKKAYLLTIFLLTVGALGICFLLYRILLPFHETGTLSGLTAMIWAIVYKVHTRFSITANLYADPNGAGYQLIQGKKALWMSGFFGNTVNFHAIPVAESDMAFIALVNAFGFVFGFLTVFLFLRILISGSELSRKLLKKDVQDSVVVYGATVLICLQAAIVILGSCNVIPFAGLPIPFLSRGFTYQTIVYCFLGVILHMSEYHDEETLKGGDRDEEEGQSQGNPEEIRISRPDRETENPYR